MRAHTTITLSATDLANVSEFVRQIGREEAAVTPPSGLKGEYFASVGLTGAPVLTRYETVNFSWGTASPGAGVPAETVSTS